jgi:hypothetical protein
MRSELPEQKYSTNNLKKIHRLLTTLLFVVLTSDVSGQSGLNPTGTYEYKGPTRRIDGQTFGPYYGHIQVKKLGERKIVMTFFICKGEPSYNSGSFVDTILLVNNIAIYTDPEMDSTCRITFSFDKRGVKVKEETADFNMGCGFGHSVVAHGYFKKVSSKQPRLLEPLTGEEVK